MPSARPNHIPRRKTQVVTGGRGRDRGRLPDHGPGTVMALLRKLGGTISVHPRHQERFPNPEEEGIEDVTTSSRPRFNDTAKPKDIHSQVLPMPPVPPRRRLKRQPGYLQPTESSQRGLSSGGGPDIGKQRAIHCVIRGRGNLHGQSGRGAHCHRGRAAPLPIIKQSSLPNNNLWAQGGPQKPAIRNSFANRTIDDG